MGDAFLGDMNYNPNEMLGGNQNISLAREREKEVEALQPRTRQRVDNGIGAKAKRKLRLDARKALYSQKRKENPKEMSAETKRIFEMRRTLLQTRPATASKKIHEERNNFIKFLNGLPNSDQLILGYSPQLNQWDAYDFQAARGGSTKPFTVTANGSLRGGPTVLMKRHQNLGLLPMNLSGEPNSALLSAVAKYFDPTQMPHVRLVKFVANTVFRKGHKPRGRPGLSDNQARVY